MDNTVNLPPSKEEGYVFISVFTCLFVSLLNQIPAVARESRPS